MIGPRSLSSLLVLALVLTACGPIAQTSGSSGLSTNQIAVTELSDPVAGLTAYEVVQRYRSHWLRKRGPTSVNHPVPIKVYLDGLSSPYGSLNALRQIQASDVATITHFDAQEAQARFGLGNVAGAILVETRPAD